MKALRTTGQFDKDLRLIKKRGRGFPIDELEAVVDRLRTGKPLPPNNRDHALKGDWQRCRECHVRGDWLLIYQHSADEVVLVRTGTHSDLFAE